LASGVGGELDDRLTAHPHYTLHAFSWNEEQHEPSCRAILVTIKAAITGVDVSQEHEIMVMVLTGGPQRPMPGPPLCLAPLDGVAALRCFDFKQLASHFEIVSRASNSRDAAFEQLSNKSFTSDACGGSHMSQATGYFLLKLFVRLEEFFNSALQAADFIPQAALFFHLKIKAVKTAAGICG
jgi:hypothetical protein